jgi:FAD:protein FMN transferase
MIAGEPRRQNAKGFRQVWVGQTAATILGTAFWLIIALILHPVAYGHLAWLVSIGTLVSALCTLGLGTTVATFHPRGEGDRLVSSSVLLTMASAGAGALITATLLSLSVDRSLAILTGALVIALSMFSIAFYVELGRRAYDKYMWLWIGVRLASLGLPLALYSLWGSIPAMLGGIVASYLIFGSLVLRYLRHGFGFAELRKKIGFSVKAWGSSMAGASLHFLDKILIGALFPLSMLAVYQFSFRIFLLMAIVPNALFFYLLPERSGGGEVRKFERAGVVASVAIAIAVVILAPYLSSHVFPDFREGIDTMRIMGIAVIPATLARIRSSQLFAEERAAVVLGSNLFGLAIGITCIIITFTQGFGLIGLATSMLASEFGLLAGLFMIPRLLSLGRRGAIGLGLITAVLASALMMGSLGIIFPQITLRDGMVTGTHLAMDTNVTIKVPAGNEEEMQRAREAIRDAFREIDRIEKLMSTENRDSQVYMLNNSGTRWVSLSSEVTYVLKQASDYGTMTDGHFDVTVKPLVDFWMKKILDSGKMPTGSELSQYLELVDYGKLVIDEENSRARFVSDGMEVTLGGIAKGYAVDRACEILQGRGITEALVDIGGDIRTIGERSWTIGIADPRAQGEMLGVIRLKNMAVATSGDYQRYHLIGTERVHHIISPKTGEPASASMSVTIIAENCLTADALSTGVFVMGPEAGRLLLDSIGVGGLIVDARGQITTTNNWDYEPSQ